MTIVVVSLVWVGTCYELLGLGGEGYVVVAVGVLDGRIGTVACREDCEDDEWQFVFLSFHVHKFMYLLPVFGTAAVVVYITSCQPFLHLQVGEVDYGAGFGNLEDICILIACLPLHELFWHGG